MKPQKIISFEKFAEQFQLLESCVLKDMDPYFQKIDLHFESSQSEGGSLKKYTLYVTGNWKIISDSGETVVDEHGNQSSIVEFFNHMIGSIIRKIVFSIDQSTVIIEFNTKNALHIQKQDKNRWVEILESNGKLISITQGGEFFSSE